MRAAVPRNPARRLAPGVANLDAERDRRNLPRRFEHAAERPLRRVVVKPEIAGGDAPFRRNGGRLQNQQARARERQRAQMVEVPIAGAVVDYVGSSSWLHHL